MPNYDFKCLVCGEYVEEFLRMAAYDLGEKPDHCGQKMQRVFSAPAVQIITEANKKSGEKLSSIIEKGIAGGGSPPNLPGYS